MTRNRTWMVFTAAVTMLCMGIAGLAGRAAAMDMHEGEWETVMEMKMEGVPFAMPPVKTKQCITKDDAVPRQKDGESNCKVKSQKVTGNKVTWHQECNDRGTRIETRGEITYSGDSYKGNMSMKTWEGSDEPMVSTAVMSGRRLGACTDKNKRSVSVGGQEVKEVDQAQVAAQVAQAKKAQAEYEKKQAADKARSAKFERFTVPDEDPGSCAAGKEFNNLGDCAGKAAKLNLNPGEWEISTEQGMRMKSAKQQHDYLFGNLNKKTECITLESPVPSIARESDAAEIKRSGRKITWKKRESAYGVVMDERGGITYEGNSLEGVLLKTQTDTAGNTTETKTRITGKRIREGSCASQKRDYTSQKRDYTSQKREKSSSKPNPADAAVDKLKGLFGR